MITPLAWIRDLTGGGWVSFEDFLQADSSSCRVCSVGLNGLFSGEKSPVS